MKSARQLATESYWVRAQALLLLGSERARIELIKVGQMNRADFTRLANAATYTLIIAGARAA